MHEGQAELNRHTQALTNFCKILKLPLLKVENRMGDNIFVVSFQESQRAAHWGINGILAFCMINEHLYDFVDDGYALD
jgi:hypothetical protein